jgi:3-polyprenyl-4-hydroxybenzoate decarboxylase
MLAPPVGSSPSFRAAAFVCVVTSPNEVEPFSHGLCRNLVWQRAALSLIKARRFSCQEKSATREEPKFENRNPKIEKRNSKLENRG